MKTRLPLPLLAFLLSASAFFLTIGAASLPGDLGTDIRFSTTTVYQLNSDFSYSKNISFIENSNVTGNKQLKFMSDGSGTYDLSFVVPLSSAGGNSSAYIRGGDMSVIFDSGLGDVSFSNGRGVVDTGGQVAGGAIYTELHSSVSFANQGDVNFWNNTSSSQRDSVYGGALFVGAFANGPTSFTNKGNIHFIGNATIGSFQSGSTSGGGSLGGIFSAGGAISVQGGSAPGLGDLLFNGTGDIHFIDNKSTLTSVSSEPSGYATVYGAAIHVYADAALKFVNTGAVRFLNNRGNLNMFSSEEARGQGGAIEIAYSAGVVFDGVQGVEFTGNGIVSENGAGVTTVARGGAIHATAADTSFLNMPDRDIVFVSNEAIARGRSVNMYADGGAFVGESSSLVFSSVGQVLFERNTATSNALGVEPNGENLSVARGGALFLQDSDLLFEETGDVFFLYNEASAGINDGESAGLGGAIYAENSKLVFRTGTGDVEFRGNRVSSDGGRTYTANAIHFSAPDREGELNELVIDAAAGTSVVFYDPVTSDGKNAERVKFIFNNGEGSGGTILFSGEYAQSPASLVSDVSAQIEIGGGALVLEKGVTLGRRPSGEDTGSFYSQGAARLDITGSTLAAARISLAGRESVLKAGIGARFDAAAVDLSHGFSVDLGYYFVPGGAPAPGGVVVQGSSFTAGGIIGVVDGAMDYYSDKKWESKREFSLFDLNYVTVGGVSDSVEGVYSNTEGGAKVSSPYGYEGEWLSELRDGVLYAVWVPAVDDNGDPVGIKEIMPELAGSAVPNSLWSTASNMSAFSRTALAQTGPWRFQNGRDVNYWASGLGDFNGHKTRGDRDGYDYRGGGYAVGADSLLDANLSMGLAFGQIFGTSRSRSFSSKTDQDSVMGMIYSDYRHAINPGNMLYVRGSASYGNTSNRLNTSYSDGEHSSGKWDNRAWYLTLRVSWEHDLGNQWTLTPFVGAEYTSISQEAFTETGDKARRFGKGELGNLAMPVGIGVGKTLAFGNGVKWLNNLSVSYVPDVYRKNPEPGATRLLNGFSWTSSGAGFDRNAARLEWGSRLVFNPVWSLFGGYSLEGRRDSLYHQANFGVSASF